MTKVIVLHSADLRGTGFPDGSALNRQKDIVKSLTERQMLFVKQYTWRAEFNWHTGETELSIRKRDFSTQEWTRILFLFPHARLRKGPVR